MMMVLFVLFIFMVFVCVEQYCRRNKKTLLEVLHPDWFEDVTRFPEYAFPCTKNCKHYERTLQNGRLKMEDTRIIIAGLCINIEHKVPKLLKRLKHLGSHFKDYECVIFENDSSDNTRRLLTQVEKVHLVPCSEDLQCKLNEKSAISHGSLSEKRMMKMTEYRNRLLSYIKYRFSDYDCICMTDLDIDGPIDIRGLAHSFGLYDTWDTISAYGLSGMTLTLGITFYYDSFAYKDEHLDVGISNSHRLPIFLKTKMYNVGDAPYRVHSGFCGLALYTMDAIRNVDYTPTDGEYKCEHITFHKNMMKQGFDRIYINPNMLVLVGAQGDAAHSFIY